MTSPLISPAFLASKLDDSSWVVVDCRFVLTDPNAGLSVYRRGHIPGARYAHLDNDLARAPGPTDGRHPLPRVDDFVATLGSWGISNTSRVVVYDDVSGAIAARLWWMLRWVGHDEVYVLDGGLPGWLWIRRFRLCTRPGMRWARFATTGWSQPSVSRRSWPVARYW